MGYVLSPEHQQVSSVINDIPSLHDPMLRVMSGHPRITMKCRVIDNSPALNNPIQWVMSGRPDITMECRVIKYIPVLHHIPIVHSVVNSSYNWILIHVLVHTPWGKSMIYIWAFIYVMSTFRFIKAFPFGNVQT